MRFGVIVLRAQVCQLQPLQRRVKLIVYPISRRSFRSPYQATNSRTRCGVYTAPPSMRLKASTGGVRGWKSHWLLSRRWSCGRVSWFPSPMPPSSIPSLDPAIDRYFFPQGSTRPRLNAGAAQFINFKQLRNQARLDTPVSLLESDAGVARKLEELLEEVRQSPMGASMLAGGLASAGELASAGGGRLGGTPGAATPSGGGSPSGAGPDAALRASSPPQGGLGLFEN